MKFKIKRILAVMLVFCMMMGMVPNMLMTAHAAGKTTVDQIELNGIYLPEADKPCYVNDGYGVTTPSDAAYEFTNQVAYYYDAGGNQLTAAEKFEPGLQYYTDIVIGIKSAYRDTHAFSAGSEPTITFTNLVESRYKSHSVSILSISDTSLTARIYFTLAGDNAYAPIDTLVLDEYKAPVNGQYLYQWYHEVTDHKPNHSTRTYFNYLKSDGTEYNFSTDSVSVKTETGKKYGLVMEFEANKNYSFADTVDISVASGNPTITYEVSADKKTMTVKLMEEVPDGDITTISFGLSGVTAVTAGQNAGAIIKANISESSPDYFVHLNEGEYRWKDENGNEVTGQKFENGKNYTGQFDFRAETGHSFASNPTVYVISGGKYVSHKVIHYSGDSIHLEVTVTPGESTQPPATTYTITATAGEGGTISPSGEVTVNKGEGYGFAIEPNEGYKIKDVIVDGTSVGVVTAYGFSNVEANHTIEAVFEAASTNTYTITATAGEGGTITPSGEVTVNKGEGYGFAIEPNEGYKIKDVIVDGTSVGVVTAYGFSNVEANHTIEAVFEEVTPPDDTKIKEISITGLQAPVAGTAPDTPTATFTPNDKFDVVVSKWVDKSSGNISGNFVEGEEYLAYFVLDAKDGEAFDSSVTVTSDKGTVKEISVDDQGSNCWIWVKLTAVGTVTPPDDTKIKEIDITGLQAPVAGTAPGTPTATFTPNDKFDVVVSKWVDKSSGNISGNFVEGEEYLAYFVLDAKDGEAFDSSVTVTSDKGTVKEISVDDQGSNCWIWVKLTAVGTVTPEPDCTHANKELDKDADGHWYVCPDCEDLAKDVKDHEYDDDADADCNVCGYEREITVPEPDCTHANKELDKDADGHWYVCPDCEDLAKDVKDHEYDDDADATCNVCGYEREVGGDVPPVNPSVELNKDKLALVVPSSEKLTATVTPDGLEGYKLVWSSSDASVATVDQNGNVTAVAAGTATITVELQVGTARTQLKDTCEVTVTLPADDDNSDDTDKPSDDNKDDESKPSDTNKPTTDTESPKTGDTSNIFMWFAVLFVSGFALVGFVLFGRKRRA